MAAAAVLPFADVDVVEIIDTAAPALLHRAVGLAAQLALGFGARVFRLVPKLSGLLDDPFLHHGKIDVASVAELRSTLGSGRDGHRLLALVGNPAGLNAARNLDVATPAVTVSIDASFTPFRCEGVDPPINEFTALLFSGLLDMIGEAKGMPVMLGGHQIAHTAGVAGFSGLATALGGARFHNASYSVSVDALRVAAWVNWKALLAEMIAGSPIRREGGPDGAWPIMRCADGYMAIVYEERDWPRLVDIIGRAGLQPYKGADATRRAEAIEIINTEIAGWCAGRTRREAFSALQESGVPSGPVLTPAELIIDDVLCQRRFWRQIVVDGRPYVLPSMPIQWNGSRLEELGDLDPTTEAPPARGSQ